MERLKVIARRELVRIASLNSISVALKIVGGLLTSWVIAVFVGPAGMALTGNLRNFLTAVEAFALLGFQNGIVKYAADAEDDERLKKLLSTISALLLGSTLLLMIGLLVGAEWLSESMFNGSPDYAFVIRALALGLPWYIASMVMVAVLNGLGQFRSVIRINIVGNVLGVVLSVVMVYHFRTEGALLAIVLAPALQFLISVGFVGRHLKWRWFMPGPISRPILLNLAEYSLMTLVAAAGGSMVMLSIRNEVMASIGLAEAGWWEGVLRISSYYMLFLSTILAVYFLPNLARADSREMRSVFRSYFQWILPPFLFGLVLMFFARDLIISVLFTDDFRPMSSLFFWQLTGDFLKAASMILGYAFFARKLTMAFVVTEVMSLAVLWISSRVLLAKYGIEGVVMAHVLTYAVYLIVLTGYFRKILFSASRP